MNEIFLMEQSRPICSIHRGEGWTPQTIAEHGMPALRSSFYKLDRSADIFNWDANTSSRGGASETLGDHCIELPRRRRTFGSASVDRSGWIAKPIIKEIEQEQRGRRKCG